MTRESTDRADAAAEAYANARLDTTVDTGRHGTTWQANYHAFLAGQQRERARMAGQGEALPEQDSALAHFEFRGWWEEAEKAENTEPWELFRVALVGVEAGDMLTTRKEISAALAASGYELILRRSTSVAALAEGEGRADG